MTGFPKTAMMYVANSFGLSETAFRIYHILTGTPYKYHDVAIDVRTSHISKTIWRSIYTGSYESEEARFVKKYLPDGMDVIELGGGIGFIANLIADEVDYGEVYVIEPNRSLHPTIKNHAKLNGHSLILLPKAYAPDDKRVTIALPDEFWGGSTYRESEKKESVAAISLTELHDRYDIGEFALVADIEGGEMDLVSELDFLREYCQVLIIEFHHEKPEYQAIADGIKQAKESIEDDVFCKIEQSEGVAAYYNTSVAKTSETDS